MRTGGVGERLDCGHEDWRRGRKIGLWACGLEAWEKDWTVGMRTRGVGGRMDCGHEDWWRGRKIGLWA